MSSKWDTKLTAPPEAVAFYKALDLAHRKHAFQVCHVFDGRPPKCLALRGPQLCSTLGCINPRHWGGQAPLREKMFVPRLAPPTKLEMVELMYYYLDNHPGTEKSFEGLRSIIPEEDVSDEQIREMLAAE